MKINELMSKMVSNYRPSDELGARKMDYECSVW